MSPAYRSSNGKGRPRAFLVSLPWTTLTEPSLGLSILKAVLAEAGIPCVVRHLNIEMLRFIRPVTYYALANVFALNDFLFSAILDPEVTPRQRRILREKTLQLASYGTIDLTERGGVDGLIRDLLHLRAKTIPGWLEEAADAVVSDGATLVGFTCMFDQTIASLALAKLVKERAPDRLIAFGGYAVREPTGSALLKAYPWVDAVSAGEGENVVVPLAMASVGHALEDVPGILHRDRNGDVRLAPPVPRMPMDASPTPDFGDFFRDIADLSRLHGVHIPVERLPLENSRGCWWGAKHHCIFCGIHDDDMHYRAKSAEIVLRDMDALKARHGINAFRFSDYILPHRYYQTLLPELARHGRPYRLTSEMKANVTAEKFALLADAGFEEVQPGIESFSSTVLRAIDKGVSAARNVHTLLLARRHRVLAHYNILYGFPFDEPSDYAEMVAMLPRLRHLDPPSTRLEVQVTRHAPLQADPARFGLPVPVYEPSYDLVFSARHLADSGLNLDEVCYYYMRPFENAPRLSRLYREIDRLVDAWKAERHQREVVLWYEQTDGGLSVFDGRTMPSKTYSLSQVEAEVLLACEAPQKISAFELNLCTKVAMRRLDDLQLVFCEGGEIVSLVLPRSVYAGASAWMMQRSTP